MIPKFRAYSVEENIMYYPDEDKNVEWTIDDDTGFIAPLINLGNGMWGMIDKYVLMQSTGLKDEKRKMIFEGDILFDKHHNPQIGVVVFYEGAFQLLANNMYYPLIQFDGDVEIIGNIHENPELLEETE